uniref:Retrovirus-related Pol polyprotein from transposon TNT 1-94 n=1 Tax=Tanacetum cinerariifolium TaxID=118510 RepID=A0A6L2KN47_TANCI|nr:retrovirus-related Pol polyprotein from transposon TNT 1-94 [Tanacetum cinerariifolium]
MKCLHLLHMDLFGPDHLGKFDIKADDGYFLGYSSFSKAFRVYNTKRQQIEETYHVKFNESVEAIRFTNTSVDEIGIDDSSRYHPDEFLHENDPSRQYQIDFDIAYYVIPRERSLIELTQENHDDQMITQPTDVPSGNNTKVSRPITEPLVPDVTQSHIPNQASTSSHHPPGFESSVFPDYVYKLDKALYGLNKQQGHVQTKGITSNSCEKNTQSAKKQQSVAMSSAEAGYVAAAGCCVSILWMKSQLSDYDIHYKMVLIFCDNANAIAISNNPVLHSRTKHIDIIYHFIKDHILKGDIELHFIPTEYRLADIFTKPLDEPTFARLKAKLGMLNID